MVASRYAEFESDEGQAEQGDEPAPPVLDGIEPGTELSPTVDELPYISKSRIKTYLTCPFKFYLKYWCGHRTPGSYHTEKGSRLHEAFEYFHLNLMDYVDEHGERPDRFVDLMPHWSTYAQWIEQFGNFTKFEERRWEESCKAVAADSSVPDTQASVLDVWVPVEVESEYWLGEPPQSWVDDNGEPDYVVPDGPPEGSAPWMGRIDLLVKTASLPGVEGDGVSIIDYKTGKVTDKQYRHEGIYTENEFYAMLVEPHHEVDYVGNYFPQSDTLLLEKTPNHIRRNIVRHAAVNLQEKPDDVPPSEPPANFQHEEQPLCAWSNGNGDGNCYFYNICPSTWTPN